MQGEHVDPHLFILSFYVEHADALSSAVASHVASATAGQDPLDVRNALNIAQCVCRAAVHAAHDLLAAGGEGARVVQSRIEPRLVACGEALEAALAQCQQGALAHASLPPALSARFELGRAVELAAAPPPAPPPPEPPNAKQQGGALAAMQPLPPPPAGDTVSAARAWLQRLPEAGAAAPTSTLYAALTHAERVFHDAALRLLPDDRVDCSMVDVVTLTGLCTLTRRRLRAAEALLGALPCLQVCAAERCDASLVHTLPPQKVSGMNSIIHHASFCHCPELCTAQMNPEHGAPATWACRIVPAP